MEVAGPIFISYARTDIERFYKIKNSSGRMQSLIWYDIHDIKRSDPSWRRKIDGAIRDCSAMLVLCSPQSRTSDAVAAEIEIAKGYDKPIFPVWIDGNDWGLSAPFSLVSYNYTDAREWNNETSTSIEVIIDQIVDNWPRRFEARDPKNPPKTFADFLCSVSCSDETVLCVPARYPHYFEFLQDVYDRFLTSKVKPFSYGSQWCLRTRSVFFLPAPWVWAPRKPVTTPEYLERSLARVGIVPGVALDVHLFDREPNSPPPVGVVVPERFAGLLRYLGSKYNLESAIDRELSPHDLEAIDLSDKIHVCIEADHLNSGLVDDPSETAAVLNKQSWFARLWGERRKPNEPKPGPFKAGRVYLPEVS